MERLETGKNSMLGGTLWLTFSSLFGQVVGFFYRIALSRMIGAELMGLYQLIMPVYAVLSSLTASGLTVAVSALSARYGARGDKAAIRRVRRTCLNTFFVLLAPLGLLTVLLSDPISVYLLGDARTRLGLCLLVPCLLLTGIENLQKHSFFGTGRVVPPALCEMAEQVIRSLSVLGLLWAFLPQNGERTVGLIVLGMCMCEVFSACALTLLFRRYMGGAGEDCLDRRELRRQIVRIALPVGGTALLGNLMGSANAILIPQLLVKGGATVSQAMSAFGVINGMTLPMLLMPSAFVGALGLMLVPGLARTVALGRTGEARERLGRVLSATSLLILPAMALLSVIGPSLGTILFKDPRVGEHILPLAVGVALSCYQAVLGSALNGLGKQSAAAGNMLLSDGVQLAFTWFFVGDPRIGLGGYVTGLWVSSLVGALLNYRDVRKAVGIRVRAFPWLIAPGLASLLMGLCCRFLFRLLLDAQLGTGVVCLSVSLFGAVLYLAALQAQGALPSRSQKAQ